MFWDIVTQQIRFFAIQMQPTFGCFIGSTWTLHCTLWGFWTNMHVPPGRAFAVEQLNRNSDWICCLRSFGHWLWQIWIRSKNLRCFFETNSFPLKNGCDAQTSSFVFRVCVVKLGGLCSRLLPLPQGLAPVRAWVPQLFSNLGVVTRWSFPPTLPMFDLFQACIHKSLAFFSLNSFARLSLQRFVDRVRSRIFRHYMLSASVHPRIEPSEPRQDLWTSMRHA